MEYAFASVQTKVLIYFHTAAKTHHEHLNSILPFPSLWVGNPFKPKFLVQAELDGLATATTMRDLDLTIAVTQSLVFFHCFLIAFASVKQ